MRSKICSVYNHGRLIEENVEFFVSRNSPACFLVLNKWIIQLPDSDRLILEDEDGYRYKRIIFSNSDHYIFEQI